jgi:hypothetical protein
VYQDEAENHLFSSQDVRLSLRPKLANNVPSHVPDSNMHIVHAAACYDEG